MLTHTYRHGLVVTLVAALAFASSSEAVTINKCAAGKKKCVAKKLQALAGCYAKAEAKGVPVDPACLQKAKDKFDGGVIPSKGCFEKLETKYPLASPAPCLTFDDTALLEDKVDVLVENIVSAVDRSLRHPIVDKCGAGKKKCAAKLVAGLLGCHAKSEITGTLDAACVLKASQKFDGSLLVPSNPAAGCFEKLEAKYSCQTVDDTVAVRAMIEDAVEDVVCLHDPGSGACPTSCPTSLEITPQVNQISSDIDHGWAGLNHDGTVASNATLSVNVTSCASAVPPCGVCSFTGPIPNASADSGTLHNRRCKNDTATKCTSDGNCQNRCVGGSDDGEACVTGATCDTGLCTGGTCEYHWGVYTPHHVGGVGVCTLHRIVGAIAGTADVESGAMARSMTVDQAIFVGGTIDEPCPTCNGDATPNDGVASGTCDGGERHALACDANASARHAQYGQVSLDCPPGNGTEITFTLDTPNTVTLASTTATASGTLSAASPNCSFFPFTSNKCLCDTCNNGSAQPCAANADCPDPPGPVGPICGGERCLSGANAGAPCSANSECPGGFCNPAGEPTAPNACLDDTTTPGFDGCVADLAHEGHCSAGPISLLCSPPEDYRSCLPASQAVDCPLTGLCNTLDFRECFLDNGQIGASVTAQGAADAPLDATAYPTLAAVSCAAPVAPAAVNIVYGLPGPFRIELSELVRTIP